MRRSLVVPTLCLLGIGFSTLGAGFLSPGNPTWQDRQFPSAPPMGLHFRDTNGHWHVRPFVQGRETADLPLRFFVTGDEYRIAGLSASRLHFFGVTPPSTIHLLGTDSYGRDILSRLLYGGQVSLLAGVLGTAISLFLATLAGGISGYFAGLTDQVLMRLAELFLAVPWMYLLLAVRAVLPLHLESSDAFLLLIAIIGAVGWARPARLIRGVTLSARERGWVSAARGFGASDGWILRHHILPEAKGVLFTQAALLAPQFVLAEVTLSFLGLGAGEPAPSWGGMLASASGSGLLDGHWWLLSPAIALTAFCWSCYSLADALRDGSKTPPPTHLLTQSLLDEEITWSVS